MIGTVSERLEELDRLYPFWEEDTLYTRFRKSTCCFSENEFVVYKGKSYTYAEALKWIDRIAKCCFAIGIRKGDHVGVLLYNCPEAVFLIFALSRIGAVRVPINMKMSDTEKSYVIRQSSCRYLISSTFEKIPQNGILESISSIVLLEKEKKDTLPYKSIGWSDFLIMGDTQEMKEIPVNEDPMSLCDIMYTSGSTSFPKGVMLTGEMLLRSSYGTCRTRRMEAGRRILIPIPLYHVFAYNEGLLAAVWVGGTVILTSQKAEGIYIYECLKRYGANDIIAVPLIIIQLLDALEGKTVDFPNLHAGYWASTCPDWVWEKAKKVLGITDVTTGYGMTECSSTSAILTAPGTTEELLKGHGYIKDYGCAAADAVPLELQIRDMTTGEIITDGDTGELWCRGRCVTPGYYKRENINGQCFDSEGWFQTGDTGFIDEKGMFSFQGRKDQIYKVNGENVSPQFLNWVLGSCEKIKAAETVGIEDERSGAAGVVFVELIEKDISARNEIMEYMKSHLAGYQLPRYMIETASSCWPRTSAGKICPGELKKLAGKYVQQFLKKHGTAEKEEIIWIRNPEI